MHRLLDGKWKLRLLYWLYGWISSGFLIAQFLSSIQWVWYWREQNYEEILMVARFVCKYIIFRNEDCRIRIWALSIFCHFVFGWYLYFNVKDQPFCKLFAHDMFYEHLPVLENGIFLRLTRYCHNTILNWCYCSRDARYLF